MNCLRRSEVQNVNECKRIDGLEVKKVIVLKLLRGEGTEEDMCRIVTQYYDLEGNFLFEIDPCKKQKE